MHRMINGTVFEGTPSVDRWIVTLHDLGNGHREGVIQRAIDWQEVCTPTAACMALEPKPLTDAELAEKDHANKKRAARRAKTRVRRLCKAQGLDTLFTLTYKANQTDLDLCKRHFELLRKRMNRLLGSFCYVAAFEQQERGAWHIHIATHALPRAFYVKGVHVKSFNVIRAMWRDIAGELGGNFDQSRRKRYSRKSPARVASYLSKYILKAFEEGADFAKRYLSSRCDMPKGTRMQFITDSLVDLVALLHSEVCDMGRVLCSAWVSPFGDVVYLCGELDP
jgi:hypothetical protein